MRVRRGAPPLPVYRLADGADTHQKAACAGRRGACGKQARAQRENAGVRENREGVIKYFGIVTGVIIFVLLYVWQNVEVMKMKMAYRENAAVEKRLLMENDRLRAAIERYRRVDVAERYARLNGMRELRPSDIIVVQEGKKGDGK